MRQRAKDMITSKTFQKQSIAINGKLVALLDSIFLKFLIFKKSELKFRKSY